MVPLGVSFPLQDLPLCSFTSYQPVTEMMQLAGLAFSAPRSPPKAFESMVCAGYLICLSEGQYGSTPEKHVGYRAHAFYPISQTKTRNLNYFLLYLYQVSVPGAKPQDQSFQKFLCVCECSHNFPATIHFQKFWTWNRLYLLMQILFPSPRNLK